MSQHSISHGSGAHGISAQSLLALDVVIASGALLRTGTSARGAAPFSRWYGPDLGGLFCGDCGTLGVKARVTLPLLRRMPAVECLSFGFQDFASLAAGLRAASLERLDDEHFAIDAAISQGQIARQQRTSPLRVIQGVWQSAPTAWDGIKRLITIARAGTGSLSATPYMTHFIVEGVSPRDARAKAGRLRDLMNPGGVEISNAVPLVVRGLPFAPLYNTLGPNGERWVPVHGFLPHSLVERFHAELETYFVSRQSEMNRLGIWRGGMYMTVGSSAFLYEIALYWPGLPSAYHLQAVPPDYLARLPAGTDCPEATALVDQIKADLLALYSRFGAAHFQLGKVYPYGSVLAKEPLNLIRAIKRALDPEGLMTPEALEL